MLFQAVMKFLSRHVEIKIWSIMQMVHCFASDCQVLSEMTGGGLDYTFECIGNVKTMVCNSLLNYSMAILFV